jgi:demethylmenaquinone methyltransferase/2-methoxy-6-polyprenyl-1,4-benzoquinol methylase
MARPTGNKKEEPNPFVVTDMTNRQLFFNEIANTWDKRFQTQELINFLEQIVPTFGLMRGQKILDIGTGTGILIPFLLREVDYNGHVTAIDYAEKMIEICRSKYGHLSNVSLEVQNIEQLDFPSESFDAVTCFGLFPHLENKQEVLHRTNRVLKPGGKLIIVHALSSAEIKVHHHNASGAVAHDALPNNSEMRRLLKQAGFARIRIIDKPGCYLCQSYKSSVLN